MSSTVQIYPLQVPCVVFSKSDNREYCLYLIRTRMSGSLDGLSAEKALLVQTGLSRGSKLEMSLACSDVPRMDVMSKSDPFCVVYIRAGEDCWNKLGTTETIVDTHSCRWARKFFIDQKSVCSNLRFEVYDRDSERENLKDHDFIGYVEGKLVLSILESDKSCIKLELSREGVQKKVGFLSVTLDWIEKPLINYDVTFEVQVGYSVRAKMYFQIMKKIPPDSQYVPVFRSQLLAKHDAQFEPTTLKLSQLSAGSSSRVFRIELFQFYPMGRSKVLGFVRTSVDELSEATANTKIPWNSCNTGLDTARVFVTSKGQTRRQANVFQISILE